jgi:hypothetical protein
MIPSTDPEQSREHVDALLTAFPTLTKHHVSVLAGVTRNTVYRLYKPGMRIAVESEAMLLAVRPQHVRLMPPRHVPKDKVVEHIETLLASDHGVNPNTIAKASGISYQTLYNILSGRSERVQWVTHCAIMGVTPEMALGKVYYRPLGPTLTRIRALQANGWTLPSLDLMFGRMLADTITDPTRSQCTAASEAAVLAMYNRIGDTPGPSSLAAKYARRLGYYPPIHYDENMRLLRNSIRRDDAA